MTTFHRSAVCACGEHAWAVLTRGYVTFVDAVDFPLVSSLCLNATVLPRKRGGVTVLAKGEFGGRTRPLHKQIIDAPEVDHRDGDTLNNRRGNLRAATRHQNNANRRPKGRFKGIRKGWNNRWEAKIHWDKERFIGVFDTPEQAALAYDIIAHHKCGEFAWLNFPERLAHSQSKATAHA